jgi:thiol-disulfide isomerase/thioredoxin
VTPRGRRAAAGPAPPLVLHTGLLLVLLTGLLTGCGAPQLSSGDQGFVTGDGAVSVLPEDERREPQGEVSGETVDGVPVSLDDHAGKVVVVPVWGSWCAPCRAEAPGLAAAARDLRDDGVAFLGIDARDRNKVDVRRFLERFDIPYDSIHDEDGRTMLAFRGTLPPMSIPSFVFIDDRGRVAARIIGEADLATLYGVLEELTGKDLTVPRDVPAPGSGA